MGCEKSGFSILDFSEGSESVGKEMNIQEVQKVKESLSMLDEFKGSCHEEPFYPTVKDLAQLQNDVAAILDRYMDFLREWGEGNILFTHDDASRIPNAASMGKGKNAPAYKDNIDEEYIYRLWKENRPIREIARIVGCAPDTVKRRILKLEHRLENK